MKTALRWASIGVSATLIIAFLLGSLVGGGVLLYVLGNIIFATLAPYIPTSIAALAAIAGPFGFIFLLIWIAETS